MHLKCDREPARNCAVRLTLVGERCGEATCPSELPRERKKGPIALSRLLDFPISRLTAVLTSIGFSAVTLAACDSGPRLDLFPQSRAPQPTKARFALFAAKVCLRASTASRELFHIMQPILHPSFRLSFATSFEQ